MDEKIMRVLIDMTNAFEYCAEEYNWLSFAVDEDQDKMNKAMAEAHEVIRFYHHVGAEEEEKAEQEYEVSHEECAGILGLSVAQYIADYINRERENSNTVWRTSCASQIWNGCSALILDALDTWKERRIT